MRFAAHQPNFLPYAGFWLKMDRADVFGLMPSVQFTKGDYQNRVLIGKTPHANWLTIPVSYSFGDPIERVELASEFKQKKIIGPLKDKYRKTAYWAEYGLYICDVISEFSPKMQLVELNLRLFWMLKEFLEIDTHVVEVYPRMVDASENLALWTHDWECEVYISGMGARYLDESQFTRRNLSVERFSPSLREPYQSVSILTALMELGPRWRECSNRSSEED